jgi:hypothetical protein
MSASEYGRANEFTFSAAECADGIITPNKLSEIEKRFREHGLVLLKEVIPRDILSSIRPRLEEDLLRQLIGEDGKVSWTAGMGTPGHYGTYIPKHKPWVHPDVHANRVVEAVVETLLGGPGFFMVSAGGNCALPGSGAQDLHSDGSHMWKTQQAAGMLSQGGQGAARPPCPRDCIEFLPTSF